MQHNHVRSERGTTVPRLFKDLKLFLLHIAPPPTPHDFVYILIQYIFFRYEELLNKLSGIHIYTKTLPCETMLQGVTDRGVGLKLTRGEELFGPARALKFPPE